MREFLEETAPAPQGRLFTLRNFVLFWLHVVRDFVRNRCPVRASALSYTTLLALVPMFAVVVGATSVFLKSEGEERVNQFIERIVEGLTPPALATNTVGAVQGFEGGFRVEGGPTNSLAAAPDDTNSIAGLASLARDTRVVAARKEVARNIHQFIGNIRSGTLGTMGTVLLLFVAITLLSRIEETMNDIWGGSRGRGLVSRTVHYWFALTLGPTLLIAGMGLAGGPAFSSIRLWVQDMPLVGGLVFKVLPLGVLWLAFTLFYLLMPNTRVRWNAAAVGGLVGSLLWFLNNYFGFLYVSRVVSNSMIYGSLGLVPVFMIGLYFSWLILLFGAQTSYVYQNRAVYLQDRMAETVNQRGREFISLRLMTFIGQRFLHSENPPTIALMAVSLSVPSRLVQQVIGTLLAAKLVHETSGPEPAYTPARSLDAIDCHDILLAMRSTHGQELSTREEPVRDEVYGEFARIQEVERQAASSVTLLALVNRAQARLELAATSGAASGRDHLG